MKKANIFYLIAMLLFKFSFAQDSTLIKITSQNTKTFTYSNQGFTGEGWEDIVQKVNKSANVLIGEDHFSNEIPEFISHLVATTHFDNFYIEVDPYSTEIIENSIKTLQKEELIKFNKEYGELFSFYALESEYELLKQVINSGTNLLGSDQVIMYADALIFQDLKKRTSNQIAKKYYDSIIVESKRHLEGFYKNPQNPMYLMTPKFSSQLMKLKVLSLSEQEHIIINDIEKSIEIYQKGSHKIRVNLLMRQLMKDYELWENNKNLFKYGANHLFRGESFLTTYDIGNLVANITESNEKESLHIMVVGESGMVGSPLKIFPATKVDPENGAFLKSLKPFFQIADKSSYYSFNLLPLRKALNNKRLMIDNINLERVIKGYDILVIIPELTPAKFIEQSD